jgi:hypothetical protein
MKATLYLASLTCCLLALSLTEAMAQRTQSTASPRSDGQNQSRLAPPPGLKCDANSVTSFTGRVLAYSRKAGRIFVRVRTDEETTEAFTFNYNKRESPEKYFLLNGEPLKPGDLAMIDWRLARSRATMRLTVWACYLDNGRRLRAELIDWRPVETGTKTVL